MWLTEQGPDRSPVRAGFHFLIYALPILSLVTFFTFLQRDRTRACDQDTVGVSVVRSLGLNSQTRLGVRSVWLCCQRMGPRPMWKLVLLISWVTLVGLSTLGMWGCQTDSPLTEEPAPSILGMSQVIGRVEQAPGAAASIVILESHEPLEIPVPNDPVEMDQYGRAFFPQLIVVREGQTVRFKNSENELHNVNVIDGLGSMIFNIGMPILGGAYDHTFEHAGDYAVACNVHQEMAATIVVTPSPFAVVTDREGKFAISDVPFGSYDFIVRRGTERVRRVVTVDATELKLVIGTSL